MWHHRERGMWTYVRPVPCWFGEVAGRDMGTTLGCCSDLGTDHVAVIMVLFPEADDPGTICG